MRATLGELETAVRAAGLASPVLFVIGPVVEVLDEGDAPTSEGSAPPRCWSRSSMPERRRAACCMLVLAGLRRRRDPRRSARPSCCICCGRIAAPATA